MSRPSPIIVHTRLLVVAVVCCVGAASGCNSPQSDQGVFAGLFDTFNPPTPTEAAMDLFDVHDPDARRRAIVLIAASDFGGEPPYVNAYRLLLGRSTEGEPLAADPDPTVRGAAAAALGRHGTVQDAPLLAQLLGDPHPYPRWQAAMALQKIHNPQVVGELLTAATRDEDPDVRMAAARALGQYPQRRVFDALVGALADKNFAVVEAAQESLRTLTGKSLGPDPGAWLAWAEDNRQSLFDERRPYAYKPYDSPPGLIEKMQFWKDRDEPEPRRPVGIDSAS